MSIQLTSQQTFLFIGDSITDAGRKDESYPHGSGYARMFSDILSIREPAKRIHFINRGINGHTVDDLRSRWSDHVLAHRPDQLVIKIGINDLNRWLQDPVINEKQSPEQFRAIYDEIITITQKELPDTRILLVSPFYASLETNPHAYRHKVLSHLPEYIQIVEDIARKHQLSFLNLHHEVQTLLAAGLPPDVFAEDAVHPFSPGVLFIAEKIYSVLS
ncbi:SGNH/GDSL hydrolase family protein [Kiritimatiellota bacterium B12222]|nr:SGNH/GDSL hydrolase family protein [Kiritimatiellota bacterium B12222]